MRQAPNITDPGRVIAHRGASRVAPENTLAAFREAARQGVWWVEFDVSLLGDHTAVMHHDATLDRCTSASGPLSEIGKADLAGITAGCGHAAAFEKEPLPQLGPALDLLGELRFYANLEMKPHDGKTGMMSEIVAEALKARPWTSERIIVSSFDLDELAALRSMMPEAALAVLFRAPPDNWPEHVAKLNAAALHIHFTHISQSLLTEAARRGTDVRVYTINQPELMVPFRELGLTGIITDHPPLFLGEEDWLRWSKS